MSQSMHLCRTSRLLVPRSHQDNCGLAVVVTKAVDYPDQMRDRRKTEAIRRYLPFKELADTASNSDVNEEKIIKRLKVHSKL